jgi:hypothetical protein
MVAGGESALIREGIFGNMDEAELFAMVSRCTHGVKAPAFVSTRLGESRDTAPFSLIQPASSVLHIVCCAKGRWY